MSSNLAEKLKHFDCQRCNECCRQPGYVYINEEEAKEMAAFLGLNVYKFTEQFCNVIDRSRLVLKKQVDESCAFLTVEGCSVHPAKPIQCREFPTKWRTANSFKYCEGLKVLFGSEQS